MKTPTFILAVLINAAVSAQPLVNISVGTSTSAPYGNLSIGYRSPDNVTIHGSVYFTDKSRLVAGQIGYNATLGERFNLQVSGGGGVLKHNGVKKENIKPSNSFVPVLSTSLDWMWGERGGMFLEVYSALKQHGAGVGFKIYIK